MKTKNRFRKAISGLLAFSMIFSLTTPSGVTVRADNEVPDTVTETSTTEDTIEAADKLNDSQDIIVTEEQDYVFEDSSEEEVTEENTSADSEGEVEKEIERGPTEEATEVTEEKTETVTEQTTEAKTEETTEETTEEKKEEEKEAEVVEIDATTLKYRLLVATSNEDILTSGHVISGYDGVYLVGYLTSEERDAGYSYYDSAADIVEYDDENYTVADDKDVKEASDGNAEEEPEEVVINQDDALTILEDIPEVAGTIAVIDTGSNTPVAGSVSVIGDSAADDNGHGTDMINIILAENPKASILSIKAFGADGKAKPSDIYAAIRYAIDNDVKYINMSFSAYSTADNTIVKDIIDEAIDKGIIVIGAAGNKGKDIKYFIPGNIEKAIIVGAIDKDKKPLPTNNIGATLDYLTYGDSTSEATARFTGIVSKVGLNKVEENEKIFKHEYKEVIEEELEEIEEDAGDIQWLHQDWNQSSDFEICVNVDGTDWPSQVTLENLKITGENYGNILHDSWYNPATGEGAYYRGTELYWSYSDWSLPAGYDKSNFNLFKGMGFCTAAGYTAPVNMTNSSVKFDICTKESSADYAWYYASGIRMTGNDKYQTIGAKIKLQYTGGSDFYIGLQKSSSTGFNPSMDGTVYEIVDTGHNVFWTVTLGSTGCIKEASAKTWRMYIDTDDYFEYRGIVTDDNGKTYLHIHRSKTGGTWDNAFQLHEKSSNVNYTLNTSYDPIPGITNGEHLILTANVCPSLNETPKPTPPSGMVQAYKVDQNGNPMSGVQFSLFKTEAAAKNNEAANRIGGPVTTSAYGIANFTDLSAGTYYLKETKGKDGYAIDEKVYPVTINLDKTFGVAGQNYGYVFNSDEYISNAYNPAQDLKNAFGTNKDKLAGHFCNHGMRERRRASANFDFTTYRNTYEDLRNEFGEDCEKYYIHYLNHGAKENRLARPASEYKSMSFGVNQNQSPVVVVKVENKQLNDYYVALKKTDDAGNAMVGVTFNLTFKDNDANVTRTFKPSYDGTTYLGIWSGFNGRVTSSTSIGVNGRNSTRGLSVIYLGKFVNAPTDIKATENWISVSSGPWAGGKAELYKGSSSAATAVYKSDYVTSTQEHSLTAATSESAAIAAAYTFKNERQNYYIGIYKKNEKNEPMKNVTFDVKVNGTKIATQMKTGTDGIAVLDLGKFDTTPTVEVQENWTNSKYAPLTTGYRSVNVYTTQSDAESHAKDSKHTWINTEKVYVTALKKSSNPTCTDGNPNYDLAGTQYGLYKTQADANADTNRMHVFTFDSAGKTTAWAIPDADMSKNPSTGAYRATTFYLREIKAGKNYELSTTVTPIVVTGANTESNPASKTLEDTPEFDPVQIDISKVDADGNPVSTGAGSLEGAQFTIKFYAVDADTNYTAAQLGALTENAHWTIETKKRSDGAYTAKFDKGWLVGTDNSPFYYDSTNSDPMIPAGYITIEETKAPTGYSKDNASYNVQKTGAALTAEGGVIVANTKDMNNLTVGNTTFDGAILLEEQPIRGDFTLSKTDNSGRAMANVEFEITSTVAGITESHTFKTGADGKYSSKTDDNMWFGKKTDGSETPKDKTKGALPYGTYVIREKATDANKGYQIQPEMTINITSSGQVAVVKDANVSGNNIIEMPVPTMQTSASVVETNSKLAITNKEVTLKDIISWKYLKANTQYTLVGRLMVVDKDGNSEPYKKNGSEYTVTKSFTVPAGYTNSVYEKTGTTTMDFVVDTTGLEGKKIVVFEKLYLGTNTTTPEQYKDNTNVTFPITHEDLNDSFQTISVPNGHTTAWGIKDKNLARPEKDQVLTDRVYYEGLIPGEEYTIETKIWIKADTDWDYYDYLGNTGKTDGLPENVDITGHLYETEPGKPLVEKHTFTATAADGYEDITVTIDGSKLAGRSAVFFEELFYQGVSIDIHADVNDYPENIHEPIIGTRAFNVVTGNNEAKSDDIVDITDTVMYKCLCKGETYIIRGVLMNKKTGKPYEINGKQVTAEGKLVIPAAKAGEDTQADGTFDIKFENVDTKGLEGDNLVAFERLYVVTDNGEELLTTHEVLDFDKQTIHFPKIRTTIKDTATNDNISSAISDVTLVDTIVYENLLPNTRYTATGQLVVAEDKSNTYKPGEALKDADGKPITKTVEFTSSSTGNGSVDVTFTIKGGTLPAGKIVAFEKVERGITVAIHASLSDTSQTTTVPQGKTTAVDEKTADHTIFAEEEAIIKDTIHYEGLKPSKSYRAVGVLMDKKTQKPFTDANGNEITSEVVFTADKENGDVEVPFKVNTKKLNGATIVVFENVYDEATGVELFRHCDINSEEQSIHVPTGHTNATDSATGDHIGLANDDDTPVTIKDEVSFYNLIPQKKYHIEGIVMDKDTEKPLLDENGKMVVVKKEFVPDSPDGTVIVEFTMAAKALRGKTAVIFESVTNENGKNIFIHADISDEAQTVRYPSGKTTVKDAKTGDHITLAEKDAHIDDTITYEHLLADGREYTAVGVLYDQATGKPLLDADGNEITNTVKFVPESENGEVVVPFTFDASILKGQSITCFEDIYVGDKLCFMHHSLHDAAQTTKIPGGHTDADDAKTQIGMGLAEPKATVYDYVFYNNLIADGREYTAVGTLMDKATNKPLLDKDGKEITNTVTFKPEKEDGYVVVPFEFDASLLKGKQIVVFEKIRWNDRDVFIHAEITSRPQTIYYPDVVTTATMKNAGKKVTAGDSVTVVDEVAITNILPNEKYVVKGVLMNKRTNKPFTVGGKELRQEKTFTADDEKALITVEFNFSTKGIDKIDLVVFEELYVIREIDGKTVEVKVGEHADLTDKNQTVSIITVPNTGDTSPVLPIAGAGMVAMAGAVAIMFYKKKKRTEK